MGIDCGDALLGGFFAWLGSFNVELKMNLGEKAMIQQDHDSLLKMERSWRNLSARHQGQSGKEAFKALKAIEAARKAVSLFEENFG